MNVKSTIALLVILLCASAGTIAQTGAIKGSVKTSDGQPPEFINVALKGTNKGAATNTKGEFEIKRVEAGSRVLLISFVGLETREISVEVRSNEIAIVPDILLNETREQLDEVVILSEKTNKFAEPESEYVAKMSMKNLENPQVYSLISKKLLEEQLVFSVDDAVKNAPGVQKMWDATGRGGDGGAYYNARGFILQSQLRNGIAGNVTSRIDAANLERIEVIKGPSATLFGSTLTSYGGLINRVTKRPYENFGGEIAYSAGSYGFNRISADVNAPLNKEKNILFRLNTAYNYEGSFQDNGYEKGYVIAPSLFYKVNDKLSFNFDAELYSGENTSKQFIFFYYPAAQLGATRADELGVDYMRSYSANDIFQVSKSNNFFLQMNYELADNWTSQTNYTSTHSFSDGPYAYFYLVPNAVVTGDPTAAGSDYIQRADQSTANSEARITEFQHNFIGAFNLGSLRNRFVGGIDIFSQNSNQFFYGTDFDLIPKNGVTDRYGKFNRDKLDSALQNGTPWTWPYRYKTNTYSAYVSDVINLTDKLIASVALRVDHFDNKGSFDQATGEYTGSYNQTALAPKLGLVYQFIKEQVSFFGNYQSGFTNQTGTDFQGKTFKPEQANQLEGGVKLDALGGKLTSTISYYHISVKDVVRPYVENPNFSIQDGTQVSKGIEAEVIASPVRGFNIVAGFAYNRSILEKAEDDVVGRRPATAMSPYTANLWLSYKFFQGSLQGLGVGFGGNYASDNKILNSVYYGEFILPAYTVLGASAFYDHAKFRVGLKVDNLTDEHYWIGYTTMNPQKLRSITGSVALKF
jgi:iron complex outermembrane receptor protein